MGRFKFGVTRWSLAVCLAMTACAEQEAKVCTAEAAVQVLASVGAIDIIWTAEAGGAELVSIWQRVGPRGPLEPEGIYQVEPCEGDATNLATAPQSMYPPARPLALEEAVGLAVLCGDDRRFVALDLSGEADPMPMFPGLFCGLMDVMTTPHGTLAMIGEAVEESELWLLPSFPERAGGRRILATPAYPIYDPRDPDLLAWVPVVAGGFGFKAELHILDLLSGVDAIVARNYRTIDGAGGRWVWADPAEATVSLYVHEAGTSIPLAPYSEAVDDPMSYQPGPRSWAFNATRTHVLHLPYADGETMEAYDLAGQPVALPVVHRPFALTADGGVLAPGDDKDEVHQARPGELTPRRLRYPEEVPNDMGVVRGEVIELRWEGQLWEVPMNGEPYRLIARGVGEQFVRVDESHLLTIYEGTLTTIALPTGVRVEHARGVDDLQPGGGEGYYFTVDPSDLGVRLKDGGLWYLPPKAVIRPPKNCPLVACPNE